MDPILGGLISGGIGAISSIFNTDQSNKNAAALQAQQEAYNTSMVQQQEQYQTQMSNTAYQRQTADMRAAGLNPILAAGTGGGASTPSGATMPVTPQPRSSAAGAVGSALQSIIPTAVAMKTANATIDNLVAENARIKAQTLTEKERPGEVFQHAASLNKDVALKAAMTDIANKEAIVKKDEALSASNRSQMNATARRLLDQAGFAGRKVSDTISPATNITSSAVRMKNLLDDRWP